MYTFNEISPSTKLEDMAPGLKLFLFDSDDEDDVGAIYNIPEVTHAQIQYLAQQDGEVPVIVPFFKPSSTTPAVYMMIPLRVITGPKGISLVHDGPEVLAAVRGGGPLDPCTSTIIKHYILRSITDLPESTGAN